MANHNVCRDYGLAKLIDNHPVQFADLQANIGKLSH